ncbi:hypothetical protein CLV84_3826 [Neolewinella xylanilytica]|uniref:Uncharacterized protein n=1 Tax=Neolewinella xylanilytica TaxID=1514080 RepID=A0A2S6I123_9BACT|nr:hypothetical protein [Neolewinella xylanilytica]PPK84664.1 hypothetical protein CLV84_3826 [Neolewinella xylanilytica]
MRCILYLFFLFLCVNVSAQRRGNPAAATEAPLQQQFDEMLDASNRYQEFKVVRQEFLDAFMVNVSDSISGYTERISQLEGEMAELRNEIDANSNEVAERDATIAELNDELDTVSLLGIQLSKGTYSLIMWSLVIGLLIALLVALASTRIAAANNTELKRERDKLAAELEQSRKSRLTVEQDLRRQLQDEINRRND